MAKMKSKNINESLFYVLKVDEVKEYFEKDRERNFKQSGGYI